jgi:hypothetical protein
MNACNMPGVTVKASVYRSSGCNRIRVNGISSSFMCRSRTKSDYSIADGDACVGRKFRLPIFSSRLHGLIALLYNKVGVLFLYTKAGGYYYPN